MMVVLTICSYKKKSMKPNVKSQDKRKRSKSLKLLWLVDLGIRMLGCLSCSRNYRGSNWLLVCPPPLPLPLFLPPAISLFPFPLNSIPSFSVITGSHIRMELTCRRLRTPFSRTPPQSPGGCRKGIPTKNCQAPIRFRGQDDLGESITWEYECCYCWE